MNIIIMKMINLLMFFSFLMKNMMLNAHPRVFEPPIEFIDATYPPEEF